MEVGILQWFQVGDHKRVEQAIQDLKTLGITELRTGISWAEWMMPHGRQWYTWLIPHLAEHFTILPCLCHITPHLSFSSVCASPPKEVDDYMAFVDEIITLFDAYLTQVELWNEPNNDTEWNSKEDPDYMIFATMIYSASWLAKSRGKRTVLGGMSPTDPSWLSRIALQGALEHIDVIGLHSSRWGDEWDTLIAATQHIIDLYHLQAKVWITEAGYATDNNEEEQIRYFQDFLQAPVERAYWYSLYDLEERSITIREAIQGFKDAKEYHFGIKKSDGSPKLLFLTWQEISRRNLVH